MVAGGQRWAPLTILLPEAMVSVGLMQGSALVGKIELMQL